MCRTNLVDVKFKQKITALEIYFSCCDKPLVTCLHVLNPIELPTRVQKFSMEIAGEVIMSEFR